MKTKYIWLMGGISLAVIIVVMVIVFSKKNKQDSTSRKAGDTPIPPPIPPQPYPKVLMSDSARKVWDAVTSHPPFKNIGNKGIYNCRAVGSSSVASQHSWGNAIDFKGTPEQMEALRQWLEQNAVQLGINYTIYNREISKGGQNRHAYTGVSPHLDHVHVDFYPENTGHPSSCLNMP